MGLRVSLGEVGVNSFSITLGNVTADVLEPLYQRNSSQDGIQTDVANVAKAGGIPLSLLFPVGWGAWGRIEKQSRDMKEDGIKVWEPPLLKWR